MPDNIMLNYVNHSIDTYKGYDDKDSYELIISCEHNLCPDTDFSCISNIDTGIYAYSCSDGKATIRLPIKCANLSYYFENYRDYYYLPNEKMCVLKSVAGGVAKKNRENATKENCRVTLDGKFIYAFKGDNAALSASLDDIKKFKAAYNSKHEYIRLDDFEMMSDSEKSDYVNLIISALI